MNTSPKQIKYFISSCCISLLIMTATTVAQTPYKLKAQKMTVSGTSSLHDWTSEITKVEWAGQLKVTGTHISMVKSAEIKIAATSIKSTKGGTMDDKTYEALKSDKNPYIIYKLTGGKIKGNVIASTGSLTIAGVSKTVTINLNYEILANGDIHITGKHPINMLDYKMTPPKAVMGTIKVGETVTINIDLTLHS